jgi:hypothetical protein
VQAYNEPLSEQRDGFRFFPLWSNIMSKSHDSKKATKKEPAKTPKEKKEAKKVKKEAMQRQ